MERDRGDDRAIKECLSCAILDRKRLEPGGVIFEDDYWHLGSAIQSPAVWRGFLILKLKRHCEQMAELTPVEAAALGPIIQRACQALREVLHPAKIYVCSFGDGIQHIHFWLLPRPQGMRPGMRWVFFFLDLRSTLARLGIRRWTVLEHELVEIAAQVRRLMETT